MYSYIDIDSESNHAPMQIVTPNIHTHKRKGKEKYKYNKNLWWDRNKINKKYYRMFKINKCFVYDCAIVYSPN